MWYLFHQHNSEKKDVELAGMVHVLVTPEANTINDATIQEIIPEEFKAYLEKSVYGQGFAALDMLADEEDGFNPKLMTHWHALPWIFNVNSGYGGVEEYTDEEFLALATKMGFEEEQQGAPD